MAATGVAAYNVLQNNGAAAHHRPTCGVTSRPDNGGAANGGAAAHDDLDNRTIQPELLLEQTGGRDDHRRCR